MCTSGRCDARSTTFPLLPSSPLSAAWDTWSRRVNEIISCADPLVIDSVGDGDLAHVRCRDLRWTAQSVEKRLPLSRPPEPLAIRWLDFARRASGGNTHVAYGYHHDDDHSVVVCQ